MVRRMASLESGGHLLVERQCEVNRRFTKFLEQIEIDQEVAIHPEQQFDSVDVEGYRYTSQAISEFTVLLAPLYIIYDMHLIAWERLDHID
jgi:hypothetical protein